MQDFQKFDFSGGLNQDSDPRVVGPNQMTNAQDLEVVQDESGAYISAEPMKSMLGLCDIPQVDSGFQAWRLEYTAGFDFLVQISYFGVGTSSNSFTPADATDFITVIEGYMSGLGITTSHVGTNPFRLDVDIQGAPIVLQISRRITGSSNEWAELAVPLLTEYYAHETELDPVSSFNIGEQLFVLSAGVTLDVSELGVATRAITASGETWTYTRLLRGIGLDYPSDRPIIIKGENYSDTHIALYYNNPRPKVIYIPKTFTEDCCQKYTVTDYVTATQGDYTLESVGEQTNLQLINNIGYIQVVDQLNSGGNVLSGGYRYAVRFGVTDSNTTEFSYLTPSVVPVFKASTAGNPGVILGDKSGIATSKVNVLRIFNAKPSIFKYVEVAVVHYTGSPKEIAQSAKLIGKFYFTQSIFDVQHTGFEQDQLLSVSALPQVRDVILEVNTLESKFNRLNLFGCNIAVDENLLSVAAGVTVGQTREDIGNVGHYEKGLEANASAIHDDPSIFQALTSNTTAIKMTTLLYNPGANYNLASGLYTIGAGEYFSIKGTINLSFSTTIPAGADINYYVSARIKVIDPNSEPTWLSQEVIITKVATAALNVDSITFDVDTGIIGDVAGSYRIVAEFGGNFLTLVTTQFPGQLFFYTVNLLSDTARFGEYLNPITCANRVGYMLGETYAPAIVWHYKVGYNSKPYPLAAGTYTFTTAPVTNTLLTNDDVTDNGDNREVYAYALQISNIDISSIKSEIDGFSIWLAPVTNPSIVSTGVVIPSDLVIGAVQGGKFLTGYFSTGPAGFTYGSQVPNVNDARRFGIFISPDVLFGHTNLEYSSGDALLSYGNPKLYNELHNIPNSFQIGDVTEFLGNAIIDVTQYDIEDGAVAAWGEGSRIIKQTSSPFWELNAAFELAGITRSGSVQSFALTTDQRMQVITSYDDYGVYLNLYKRQITQQYNLDDLQYRPTGFFYRVTDFTPDLIVSNLTVWGGDTYTQKTMVKIVQNAQPKYNATPVYFATLNRTGAISFYSQNRINTQLRYLDEDDELYPYNESIENWLLTQSNQKKDQQQEPIKYDESYSAPNIINLVDVYNARLAVKGQYEARTYYSEERILNSPFDGYRSFLPLNFTDLDVQDGAGVGIFDTGQQMLFIQARAVTLRPYQADVMVDSNSGEVFVGNGAVYARRGQKISTYGTTLVSACYSGKNKNGNPLIYWFSTNYQKLLRYGSNGISILSDENYMRTFFLNNTKFIQDEFDIHMGYHAGKDLLIISARAKNDAIATWSGATTYSIGQLAEYGATDKYQTFEQTGDIYVSLINGNSENLPFDSPAAWEFIPHTDNRYYNEWTLIFNEKRNAFVPFTSFLPKRYFAFNNSMVLPKPIPTFGKLYELWKGEDILEWFLEDGDFKQGEMMFEFSCNKFPDTSKHLIMAGLFTGEVLDPADYPTITASNLTQSVTTTNLMLRRGELGTGSIAYDGSSEPMIAQFNKIRVTNQNYMRVLSMIARFYAHARLPGR